MQRRVWEVLLKAKAMFALQEHNKDKVFSLRQKVYSISTQLYQMILGPLRGGSER